MLYIILTFLFILAISLWFFGTHNEKYKVESNIIPLKESDIIPLKESNIIPLKESNIIPFKESNIISPMPFKVGYIENLPPDQRIADRCNDIMYPVTPIYVDYGNIINCVCDTTIFNAPT